MGHLAQGSNFQFPTEPELFLLAQQGVPPEQVPECCSPLHLPWQSLQVVPGIHTAKALDAHRHAFQPALLLRRIDHGQGMAVLAAPDMEYIRLEVSDFPAEPGLQFLFIAVGAGFLEGNIIHPVIQSPLPGLSRAENPQFQIFLHEVAENMVNPQPTDGGSAVEFFLHCSRCDVAQPQQPHEITSFSSIPAWKEFSLPESHCFFPLE